MSIQRIKHKRGDTFEVLCSYTTDDGTPINLDTEGATIASQIRTSTDDLVVDLTVQISDQSTAPGEYRLRALDTSDWPVADLRWDIEYSYGGVVSSTDTVIIAVREDVTHG